MKRMVIAAAVAAAAVGGAGAALVGASWPGGSGGERPARPIEQVHAAGPHPGSGDTADLLTAGQPGSPTGEVAAGMPPAADAAVSAHLPAASPDADAASPDAGVGGSATASGATVESGCGLGPWDARVQGRPADFSGGDRAGDYLWHDGLGFHLRVTHRGDRRDVFTGTLHADAQMWLQRVRLEGRDAVALSADRRTIYFRFYDYGHVDGVDMRTDCASRLAVADLRVDGYPLPASRVYLGANVVHPATVPFVLTRQAA
jgi:hypothetical protein